MPGAKIKSGATGKYAIIAENAVVEEGATVGESPEETENLDSWGITLVGDGKVVGKNAVVGAKAVVTKNLKEGERV